MYDMAPLMVKKWNKPSIAQGGNLGTLETQASNQHSHYAKRYDTRRDDRHSLYNRRVPAMHESDHASGNGAQIITPGVAKRRIMRDLF